MQDKIKKKAKVAAANHMAKEILCSQCSKMKQDLEDMVLSVEGKRKVIGELEARVKQFKQIDAKSVRTCMYMHVCSHVRCMYAYNVMYLAALLIDNVYTMPYVD